MNYLQTQKTLNNRYFVMRHGESIANQKGLIVSAPENGVPDYCLSAIGRFQLEQSVEANTLLSGVTKIFSSDFKRARESAEIAHSLLNCKDDVTLSKNLRERFFGDFEMSSNIHYQTVWDNDAVNSGHSIDNVESADAVMERTSSLVLSLEKEYSGKMFLLVSHGDALQILQAAFLKTEASTHRSLPHLQTAEIRELILAR